MNAIPFLLITSLLLTGCRTVQQAPIAGPLRHDSGGAAGYQHGLARSRFAVGATRRTVSELGFVKIVGPAGVFAVDAVNGAAAGIPNAVRMAAVEKSQSAMPLPARHNEQVLEYFIAAGIPREQVAGVDALSLLEASGETRSSEHVQPKVVGYQSAIKRGLDGILVPDSVAWARISQGNEVLSEAVYWPAIPAQALAEATRLQQRLAGAKSHDEFLALFPAGLPAGEVVIHHSPLTMREPFRAVATYDVAVPIYASRARVDGDERPVSWVVRHFDANGREIRLSHEARSHPGDARDKR